MTIAVEVLCITKSGLSEPHNRIKCIGGVNNDGTRWKLSVADAIAGIEENKWNFWVFRGGQAVRLVIAVHDGHKYLKPVADAIEADNLLALPECP